MKVLYSKKNGITNKLSGVNLPVDANKINYDNTDSELQSTNVQDAIDEVVADKADNEAIEAIVNVYGGKNLLPSYAGTAETDGIVFTEQSDGSYIMNGTSTASPTILFLVDTREGQHFYFDKTKKYIVSSGIVSETVGIGIFFMANGSFVYAPDTRETNNGEIEIDVSQLTFDRVLIGIVVSNGTTITNTHIYPMLRDARISDPTFAPYAMTNRELTLEAKKTVHITSPSLAQNGTYDFSLLSLGFNTSYKQYLIVSNGVYPQATCGAWLVYIGDASTNIYITILENHNLSLALNDNTTKTFRLTYGYESSDAEHITIKEL